MTNHPETRQAGTELREIITTPEALAGRFALRWRMLATPPKPHDDSKAAPGGVKKNKFAEVGSVDVDHLSTVEKKEGERRPGKVLPLPNRSAKDRA